MSQSGKLMFMLGGKFAGVGLLLIVAGRVRWLGRLPGDIVIERKNFTFYFSVVTCLVLSAVLTLILWEWHGRR